MAIFISTKDPKRLSNEIRDFVRLRQPKWWSVDKDGDLELQAAMFHMWFRLTPENEKLIIATVPPTSSPLTTGTYAVAHASMCKFLLQYFDNRCDAIEVTPLATAYDVI